MLDLMEKDIEFTLSEKVLIDCITNHIDQLPDMKISELAKNTYTSNATVVRLSRKLGFSGIVIAILPESIRGFRYLLTLFRCV